MVSFELIKATPFKLILRPGLTTRLHGTLGYFSLPFHRH